MGDTHDLSWMRMPTRYSKLCKSIFIWSVNTTELQLLLFKNKTIFLFFLIGVKYVNYKKAA